MRVLILLIALLVPVSGWAATYYVNKSGTGTPVDGSTFAKGYRTIAAAISARGTAGNVIEISGGVAGQTYNEKLTLYVDGVRLRGSKQLGHSGPVTVNGAGLAGHVLNVSTPNSGHGGPVVENIRFTGADTNYANLHLGDVGFCNVIDVILDSGYIGLNTFKAGGTVTLTRVILKNNGTHGININGSAGSTASYVFNLPEVLFNGNMGAYYNNAASIAFNGGVFVGNMQSAISAAATSPAVVTIKNLIGVSNSAARGSHVTVAGPTSVGSITMSYSLLLPHPTDYTKALTSGLVTNNNTLSNLSPRFRANRRTGFIMFNVDDTSNLSWFETLADILEQYGYRGTLAVNTEATISAEWDRMAALVRRGHEIASHSRTHAVLGDRRSFDIQYVGAAGTCTMTISGNRLTTTTGSPSVPSDNLDIDLTQYATAPATASGALAIYIDSLPSYATSRNTLTSGADSTTLADVSSVNIKTSATAVYFDATKYFHSELTLSKQKIESEMLDRGITYTCKSLIPPSESIDSVLQAALPALGYKIMRGYEWFTSGSFNTSTGLDMMNVMRTDVSNNSTLGNDAAMPRKAVALAEYMNEYGYPLITVGHDSSSYNTTDWHNLLTVLKTTNIRGVTMSDFADYMEANGSTSDGGRTRAINWTDQADYRLKSGSPCIKAGTPISGLTTDFLGKNWKNPPSIGAYEYYRKGGNGWGQYNFGFGW